MYRTQSSAAEIFFSAFAIRCILLCIKIYVEKSGVILHALIAAYT